MFIIFKYLQLILIHFLLKVLIKTIIPCFILLSFISNSMLTAMMNYFLITDYFLKVWYWFLVILMEIRLCLFHSLDHEWSQTFYWLIYLLFILLESTQPIPVMSICWLWPIVAIAICALLLLLYDVFRLGMLLLLLVKTLILVCFIQLNV